MDEVRSERFSVSITPTLLARLDAYAADHRWTRSTAAAELMERALDAPSGTVQVQADDLRALVDAVDMDYVSTENHTDLEDRMERLDRVVHPESYEEDEDR